MNRTLAMIALVLTLMSIISGRAMAMPSEFHGLSVSFMTRMDIAAAEVPVGDSCTTNVWSRSKSLIRNEMSASLPDLFDSGNPEVIDEHYDLFRCKDRLRAS